MESLRTLRRGLSRADGFALFLAVCNSPTKRVSLIASLDESLPGDNLCVVELGADVTDPLEEVLRKVGPNPSGPIMVVGLEKAIRSAEKNHPVLQALNLRRPEWPQRLRQAVVLWVPEYLLGFLGREAPDFLAWRSDTVYFTDTDRIPINEIYGGSGSGHAGWRVTESDLRLRVEEIRSRLSSFKNTNDPSFLRAKADWLAELGNLLAFLGELDESERVFREALQIYENLRNLAGASAAYANLGNIYRTRGHLDEAERLNRKSLVINGRLEDSVGQALTYTELGLIHLERGNLDEAERITRKALDIQERLGLCNELAGSYHNLAMIYHARGNLEEAERLFPEALDLSERVGNLEFKAKHYRNLGLIVMARGDLDAAEEMFRKSLEIDERLGNPEGMASSYNNLGLIQNERGDWGTTRQLWTKARDLFATMGIPHLVWAVQQNLDTLPDEGQPQQTD